jgi:DNA repair exonuclease SbcCD nuclease subunit
LAAVTAFRCERQADRAVPAQAAILQTPEDLEEASTAVRYVPQPVRAQLVKMLGAHDVRLIASGHVHQRRDFTYGHTRHIWAPSTGFIIPTRIQPVIGTKEVGLVEYRFQPDALEVRHVRAPGQTDVDLDSLIGRKS